VNTYLLDTSVIIDYLRGKDETVNLVNSLDGDITSSYISLAELYEGIHRVKNNSEIESKIINFFASLANIYGLDHKTAGIFGQIRAELKIKGNVIEDLDILIAATCIANNLILVTHNQKHFSRIKELKIF